MRVPVNNVPAAEMSVQPVGTQTSTVSLEGLADLLQALQPELEELGGLAWLWACELKKELAERFPQ